MVIGVVFSGILTGLAVTIGVLLLGFPLWLAILLYPLAGTLGAISFIGMAFGRATTVAQGVSSGFAAECR